MYKLSVISCVNDFYFVVSRYAITLGCLGDYEGTAVKIQNGFTFKVSQTNYPIYLRNFKRNLKKMSKLSCIFYKLLHP